MFKKPTKAESELMNEILQDLRDIKSFPTKNPSKDNTRGNVVGGKGKDKIIEAFVLGKVRSFSESNLVNAAANRRFPDLFKKLKKLIKMNDPKFKWNSIQINKNVQCSWHIDKNNIGLSYCLGLGDFQGGGLDIRTTGTKANRYNNQHIMFKYDGKIEHRSAPKKTGDRYALIWFKHR